MTENFSRKPIVITGANGFLGYTVVKILSENGAELRGLYGPPTKFDALLSGIEAVRGDICDTQVVGALVRGADTVIHLAGPPSVAASFEDPAEFVRIHGAGTACLLSACVRADVRRFVYVSSAQVYGCPRSEYVAEDHEMQARSPYAAAKICGEKLIEAYHRTFGLETVVLRPFSIYGRGSSPDAVLNKIIAMAASGESVVLYDLRPVLDYCFVEDVAGALVRACLAPVAGKTFNVGTMRGTSIRELAASVIRLLGKSSEVVEDTGRRRPGGSDILRLVADNTRAVTELGWCPKKSLEEGLRLTLNGV
ncbi:MAG: NAD-dependent epimerase/dehydratase family protein [Acidobacteriota bacterium]|nr:NAD-dependent epimerase/dehydratase family protein [Acidobacteriota bacterium]